MKCTLDTINQYRTMLSTANNMTHVTTQETKAFCHVDPRGRTHEIPLYDTQNRKINYMRKRNFLVKAQNLPKQFGFEVEVKNLHYDDRKAILAKNLVQGKSYITKLFFVFNLNDRLLEDNQQFHFPTNFD